MKGELLLNGDFSEIDTGTGLPVGWTFAANGDFVSTTVEQDTVNGTAKNVIHVSRTADVNEGAGIVQTVVSRHFTGRKRHHPSTLIHFPPQIAVTMTHKMTDVHHVGVSNFLGAAFSFYYNDAAFNGINIGRNDYYGGWGPTGVLGGQGATGGLGSTDGYVTETRIVPFYLPEQVAYCDFNFILHDEDAAGEWLISEISIRAL